MKVKFEKMSFNIGGHVWTHYIKKIKRHWWNRWEIVMDGNAPARFDEKGNVIL